MLGHRTSFQGGRPVPYAPEHKEQTRARIVECARRMFNRHGFEAVSIDQIMASAGLTRGGFYHHFANKEALYSEAIASYARCEPAPAVDFAASARQIVLQMVRRLSVAPASRGHRPALPDDRAALGRRARRTGGAANLPRCCSLAWSACSSGRSIRRIAMRGRRRWPSRRSASAAWCWRARSRTTISPPRSARRRVALALDVGGFDGAAPLSASASSN